MALVLPATLVLAPLACGIAGGFVIAMVQDVRLGVRAELMLAASMASFAAGVVGILALWAAMIVPVEALARRGGLRVVVLAGMVIGIGDALFCSWR